MLSVFQISKMIVCVFATWKRISTLKSWYGASTSYVITVPRHCTSSLPPSPLLANGHFQSALFCTVILFEELSVFNVRVCSELMLMFTFKNYCIEII